MPRIVSTNAYCGGPRTLVHAWCLPRRPTATTIITFTIIATHRAVLLSAEMVADNGYSPPTPNPRMKRHVASCAYTDTGPPAYAVAEPKHPTRTRHSVVMKMVRRPMLSAKAPKTTWPRTAPTKAAVETAVESPGVCG